MRIWMQALSDSAVAGASQDQDSASRTTAKRMSRWVAVPPWPPEVPLTLKRDHFGGAEHPPESLVGLFRRLLSDTHHGRDGVEIHDLVSVESVVPRLVSPEYGVPMTMMLRTTAEQDKILAAAAVRAGVSKQQFILDAAPPRLLTTPLSASGHRAAAIQRRDLLDRLGRALIRPSST